MKGRYQVRCKMVMIGHAPLLPSDKSASSDVVGEAAPKNEMARVLRVSLRKRSHTRRSDGLHYRYHQVYASQKLSPTYRSMPPSHTNIASSIQEIESKCVLSRVMQSTTDVNGNGVIMK